MLAQARAKAGAAMCHIDFRGMDAAQPQFAPCRFDVLVCRHLRWALPDIAWALRNWVDPLKPGRRTILIGGYWYTNAACTLPRSWMLFSPPLTAVVVQEWSNPFFRLRLGKNTDKRRDSRAGEKTNMKIAIVTGGSRGLGKEMALSLAAKGRDVI